MEAAANLTATTRDAVGDALARIAADRARNNAERIAHLARVAADPRHAYLAGIVEQLAPPAITSGGMRGAGEMFSNILRDEQPTYLRADFLRLAREAQLRGGWATVRHFLAKARSMARDPRIVAARQARVAVFHREAA